MKAKLDSEEREILRSFEAGEWRSAPDRGEELDRHRAYARATFRKDRRLNIRISGKDLEALQKRALAEGLPYQTFIASILHKYVSGRLREQGAD
ncbi:MAG: antitoxin [bacterium]|nr:antitoxin [bacterium]